MKTNAKIVFEDLEKIRQQRPLIHNITNYVVMNNTANALLSLGASPVMAHALEEVADMVKIASALAVNIGTLSQHWIEAMKTAMKAAQEKGIPIVFDPVGVGATPYRNDTCLDLINSVKPTIIRGNPSEIMALANLFKQTKAAGTTKGVDSTESSHKAFDAAVSLATTIGCVVSVSGEVDLIVDGENVSRVANGDGMMPLVTGLGCTATCLTAAFAAVNSSPYIAATNAMVVMGVTGELAANEAMGPGSLQIEFLDALYYLDQEQITKMMKLS